MSFKDLDLKYSYTSYGDNNIADSFLNPALKHTKLYQRSVGFFSSSAFQPMLDGIVGLVRNNGKIQLIASPQITDQDAEAIQLGYKTREEVVKESFTMHFVNEIDELEDENLKILAELIAMQVLDIKIAITHSLGMYHDKFGILEDIDGNMIAFSGSANETISGYMYNYEKIRLSKSWNEAELAHVYDEKKEFESLWNDTNEHLEVYEYTKIAEKNILQIIHNRESGLGASQVTPIKIRDYQEEAINAWVSNGYKGFYVMATGTGKTWTAIYSAKKLLETTDAIIVICAPYKHLIRQWVDDLEKVFSDAQIIMVSSENQSWDKELTNAIISRRYNKEKQIVIVSTIMSFNTDKFSGLLSRSSEEKLLIVDEAHRFTNRPEILKDTYKYLLGLSATPYSGSSAQKGRELMTFFGGKVFDLPIDVALKRKFLVPYNYYPIYVYAKEEEEGKFQYYSHQISSCFKNKKCINPDKLKKEVRNRRRIIAMAAEKNEHIDEIFSYVKEKDHLIVYCGDGKLFANNGEEMRHINAVKMMLHNNGHKPSQFTANENMKERMELVKAFNNGEITSLAAIRCLDEGINIPSIKGALIVTSNDDYREFVQRRGRILRTYPNKEYANIYDVIVLPSNELIGWAKIEFRRFYEYAKLAKNWTELETELLNNLSDYGLELEDVDVFDFEEMEDEMDE